MGVVAETKVVVSGKIDTIETFYGDPRDRRVYIDESVLSADVEKIDNTATGTTYEIELTGELTGNIFTITFDENTTFYDKDKVELNTADAIVVGDILYGTYELLSVTSTTTGVSTDYTYKIVPSGGVSAGYTLIESGLYVSG